MYSSTMMRAAAFRLLAARSRAHDTAVAAAVSRRLALAVFVAVLAPAEASGVFYDRTGLKAAVDAWVADPTAAEATHGPIAGWDVSRIDDMTQLFSDRHTFNEAIGAWDTSKVKYMNFAFYHAYAFNSELAWDTSKVAYMPGTFFSARAFNSELAWDTSSVTTLRETFNYAEAFNQPLAWDTSRVRNICLLYTSPSPRDS